MENTVELSPRDMEEVKRVIYLDNAATSFPKPGRVISAMNDLMINRGGNAGRGGHILALGAAQTAYECREKLNAFFDGYGATRVCFCMGATEALNIAIKGLLKRGDHVLISDLEHNAVLRPIYKMWREGIIEYSVFDSMIDDPQRSPSRICAGIASLMRRNTKMLICTGASNICSVTMPLFEIGELCRRNGILFVVDGAQCAGHLKVSQKEMNISALCLPGHKGLLGPQGCGAILFGNGIEPRTLVEGGNGVASLEKEMIGELPERLEAGTLPLPAIAGMSEGIDVVNSLGVERIADHEKALYRMCREALQRIPEVSVHYPSHEGSVILFSHKNFSPEAVAANLSAQGICVRAGYHCCALGHKRIGTLKEGAIRASFGVFNSSDDVRRLCEAVSTLKQ